MKPVVILQHADHEAPGILGEILQERNIVTDTRDFHRGDAVPALEHYAALLVMGGYQSANDETEPMQSELTLIRSAIEKGIPYFGVCLGLQVGVKAMGGTVVKNPVREIGGRDTEGAPYTVEFTTEGKNDPLLSGVDDPLPMFHLHGETVELTSKMQLLGSGTWCRNQIIRISDRAYGIQGHLELTENLLNLWCTKDEWLGAMQTDSLKQDWRTLAAAYRNNCERIFRNFLGIAEVG